MTRSSDKKSRRLERNMANNLLCELCESTVKFTKVALM